MAEFAIPLLVGGLGGTILGRALTPKMPEIPKPTVMPTVDDQAAQNARRRAIAAQISRHGRASTILTGSDDKLGG